jgi:hypothetical protein
VSSAGLEQAFLQLTGDDELSAEIDDVLTEATR